jgi:hypothetical protein
MRTRTVAAAAAAYLAVAILWHAPSSISPADTIPDLGDPLHLSYVMAWDAHQMVRRPWALYDSNSFYPYPRSLAFGDHLLPEALMVAPVFWVTGNAVLASNLGVVLALALSALAMFLLVRHLTGSASAAFLAGLMYAFNSFTRHELLRIHVLNIQWWPLALLFLDRFVRGGGRARDARLFAGSLVLQGLSGAYYLVCSAMIAPLWLTGAYAAAGRRPSGEEVRRLLPALTLAALPAALVLWPYVLQLRSFGFEKSLVDGADLLCYAEPPQGNWLFGGLHVFSGCFGLPHFLGFLGGGLMLGGAGLVLWRGSRSGAWGLGLLALVSAGVGLSLSLGPMLRVGGFAIGSGPFRALHALVPLVRGMDGSKRAGILVVLGAAQLAGIALAALFERLGRRKTLSAVALLAVLLPLEHWTPPAAGAAVPTGAAVPEVYRWLADESAGPLVELPLYPDVSKRSWAAYLYFSTYHWRPVPIGRTSLYPPAHDFLAWSLRDFPDDVSLTLLDRLGIHTIVVHPFAWDAGERDRRLASLEAEGRLQLVRRFEAGVGERFAELGLGDERVYRIEGVAPSAQPACTPGDEVPRAGWSLRALRPARPPAPGRAKRFAEWVREREWRTPGVAAWGADDDRSTAWLTDGRQRPGDGLELTLPRTETLTALALDLAYPYDEFGRHVVLVAEGGEDQRRHVPWADGPEERWATLQSLLERPREARMLLRFQPRPLQVLDVKIGAREEDAAWPRWAVPELRLFRACR